MKILTDEEIWDASYGASFERIMGCDHNAQGAVRFKLDGIGRRSYHLQCQNCGHSMKNPQGHYGPLSKVIAAELSGLEVEQISEFDVERYEAAQQEYGERRKAIYDLLRAERRQNNRQERSYYYSTPEWAEKRRLVFARANGVCEGCGTARATQCHHISYDHFGNEFLFELQALCEPCHVRWHAEIREFDELVLEKGTPA